MYNNFRTSATSGKALDPRLQPVYHEPFRKAELDGSLEQHFVPNDESFARQYRKTAFFDTRFRDVQMFPDAGRVVFEVEMPIRSVSQIALISAKVPINTVLNADLDEEDYLMLTVGVPLEDRVSVRNYPDTTTVPAGPPSAQVSNALAYLPMVRNADFVTVAPNPMPHIYYTRFAEPFGPIERIEIAWHRFSRTANLPTDYHITPALIPPGESIYDVNKNATVELAFSGKDYNPQYL